MKKDVRGKGNRGNARRTAIASHRDTVEVRNAVLFVAQQKLRQHDGRAAGIKFNKLVFSIYKKFGSATNPNLHFEIPYRWYLYGAVVDSAELGGIIAFDHEEDEIRANVQWHGNKLRRKQDVWTEIEDACEVFCEKYPGDVFYGEMLREHYKSAEEEFQRSFLEWNLLITAMQEGKRSISTNEIKERLVEMGTYFPEDLEPRITPSFKRLYLCLEGILSRPSPPAMDEVRVMKELMWDFWATFCLFLSLRYNNRISEKRLDGYRLRAEQGITAYKRRLNAALETVYLGSNDVERLDNESLKILSSILEMRFLRLIEEE